jgi:alpha-L-fucosidase 2
MEILGRCQETGRGLLLGDDPDQLAALGSSNWVGYSFAWAACAEARAGRPEKAIGYLDTFIKAFILRNGFHANGDQTRSGYSTFTYRPVHA